MKAALFIALLALVACESGHGPVELSGMTMGTRFSVTFPNGIGHHDALTLQNDIEAELDDDEALMSTYQPDSLISYFNSNESIEWLQVPEAFCSKVEKSLRVSTLTSGAFDITVGPLVNLWGFGPDKMVDEPPDDAVIEALMATSGYQNLHADCSLPAIRKDVPGLILDMSAIGKGFAADRVAKLLDGMAFEDYLVEIGGELRLRGHNASDEVWAIGVEAPKDNERIPQTVIRITNTGMATSGDYRNFFEHDGQRYSHTIDPRTGRPVTHALASVTVLDPSAWRADALATALLVMGPDDGMAFADREGLAVLMLIRTDDGVEERPSAAFAQRRSVSDLI